MISPSAGVVVNSKYVLEAPLARGGMGSVWTATHRELGVRVAVKFMDPAVAASDGGSVRFEREAKAAAHLDSRHIVQVRDYGVVDGTPYLVMELLKGESLEQRLRSRPRLTFHETLTILQQLAKGLKQAHEAGIIHRDLKPGNIFIARTDDEDVVKILDFGIAKITGALPDANATRTGTVMGSVHYASPEQLRSSRGADTRSDVWSVGVILFRMLVGELPFRGTEIADIIVKVCAEPIPKPSSMALDLPASLDAFFDRALARDPKERFQSITELVDAFSVLGRGVMHERAPLAPSSRENTAALPLPLTVPGAPLPPSFQEDRTAVWTPPPGVIRVPVPAALPVPADTTLRGPGTSSVTANPLPAQRGSRTVLFLVTALAVLGGVLAIVVVVIGTHAEKSPPLVVTAGPLATTSVAEAPPARSAPAAVVSETTASSATPEIPASSTSRASSTVPTATAESPLAPGLSPKPTASSTNLAPLTRPSATPTPPKSRPPVKKDDDVDMP